MVRDFSTLGRLAAAAALVLAAGTASAQVTTVLVVRHAEKASQTARDPHLSAAGKLRARELAHAAGAAGVTAVYATNFKRTQETVAPLAAALHLTPVVKDAGATDALVEEIKTTRRGETVLVCGHSDTVPTIVKGLSGVTVDAIPDGRFDGLYVVTIAPDGTGSALRLRYGKPTP